MKAIFRTSLTAFIAGLMILGGKATVANAEIAAAWESPQAQLKTSLVCMVNDQYFAAEQIPVTVSGKTYYGCCKGCAVTLRDKREARYAQDPYSGEEVDKAEAFIALKSAHTKDVYYFQSKENFEAFSHP